MAEAQGMRIVDDSDNIGDRESYDDDDIPDMEDEDDDDAIIRDPESDAKAKYVLQCCNMCSQCCSRGEFL